MGCLFQIGSALSSVSMAPLVIVCSNKRGAPTVFKSVLPVLPVLDATLDQPGTAMQTRHRPGARGVHGVDSGWSGVCAWFCVILSVLPVSDWVCAVQCQHGTSGDCVQQQKGCTNRLQIRFARFGRHFGSARHGNADPPPPRGPGRARCRLGVERCVCVVLCYFECAACFRLGLRCPVSAWHVW